MSMQNFAFNLLGFPTADFFNLFAADDDYVSSSIFNPVRGGRTISLFTHASKVMIRILTKRIQAKTEAIGGLGDDQFGFRKGILYSFFLIVFLCP